MRRPLDEFEELPLKRHGVCYRVTARVICSMTTREFAKIS
jgi:hypothetical protein